MLTVMGEKFLLYMEAFKPFLHAALKNTEEYSVCRKGCAVVHVCVYTISQHAMY